MKAFWSHNKYALACFLIVLSAIAIFYSEVFFSPNSYLLAPGGDGLKNYYSFMFHALHDDGFWGFNGMNYPFGENVVYTDAHPLLSNLIGVFGLTQYGIGILNFLILLSLPICSIFVFKILRHYKVELLWALPSAIVIALISPQLYRIGGHLSLSYAFAIPAIWWMLIKVRQNKPWLWSLIIALFLTIFFYTHPYLGLIMISFITAFWMIILFTEKKRIKNITLFLIQVAVPLLLFRVLVGLNDVHLNRIGEPAGFFQYYASWKSIFIPFFGPLSFVKSTFNISVGNWESWNYVGFFTIVSGITVLVYLLKNKKSLPFREFLRSDLSKFMIAAFLILMFAFCFPIKYWWAKWITEYFGALKQFRVLGRFGWVFFYVLTVFLVTLMYRVYLHSNRKKPYVILFYLGLTISAFEFSSMHLQVSSTIPASKNLFHKNSLEPEMIDLIAFVDEGEFDAVLFLPFTHMSSENVMLLGTEEASKDAFLLSYHAGIPLMNSVSSRMSLDEAILFNNFFGPEFIYKELVDYIPKEANILIVKNDEALHKRELPLIWTQEKIYENQKYKAFSLNLEPFNHPQYHLSLLQGQHNDSIQESYYINGFSDSNAFAFTQNSSFKGVKDGWHVIDTLNRLEPGEYTASIWYYIGVNRPDMVFNGEILYSDSSQIAGEFDIKQSTHIVRDWCFAEFDFEMPEGATGIRFCIIGNDSGEPFYVDDLMVRPIDAKIYSDENIDGVNYLNYNNYRVKPWPTSETEP